MRPIETLLLLSTVVVTLAVSFRLRVDRRAVALLAGAAGALLVLHAWLEGWRSHMAPALVLLALGVILLWWRRSSRGQVRRDVEVAGEGGVSQPPRHLVRRLASAGFRFLILPLLLLVAVLLPAALTVPDLPEPTGEFPVGVTDFTVRWDDRPEILTSDPNDVREIVVRAWYPANSVEGAPEPYMTRAESDGFVASAGGLVPGGSLLFSHARLAETHSYRGAPLLEAAPGAGRLPVLTFSHGYTSFLAQNTALMEELASHGYVVFSLAHTWDGSAVFPDGRVTGFGEHISTWIEASRDPETITELMADMEIFITSEEEAKRREILVKQMGQAREDRANRVGVGLSWDVWVEDRLRFMDVIEELDAGTRSSLFAGRLDLDRIGLLGMSFGGATAAEVCHLDDRCGAAINLDGGHMYGFESPLLDTDIGKPLLMVYATDLTSHSTPSEKNPGDFQSHNDFHYEPPETRGTRGDVVRIRIDGTAHLHVSDMSLMVRWIPGVASGTSGQRIAEILNRYCLAFFDEHLRSQPAPLLDGPSTEFPEVTFQSFGRTIDGSSTG